jgi:hypothetical protein
MPFNWTRRRRRRHWRVVRFAIVSVAVVVSCRAVSRAVPVHDGKSARQARRAAQVEEWSTLGSTLKWIHDMLMSTLRSPYNLFILKGKVPKDLENSFQR